MATDIPHVNVFVRVNIQGVLSVWTKSRTYPSKRDALEAKDFVPDAGFVYIGSLPISKLPIKVEVL
jgi:hypothetical protein